MRVLPHQVRADPCEAADRVELGQRGQLRAVDTSVCGIEAAAHIGVDVAVENAERPEVAATNGAMPVQTDPSRSPADELCQRRGAAS